MSKISILGLGVASKSPYVTAKIMQNVYAETRPEGEKSVLVGFGTPGLELFCDFGASPNRGALEFEANNLLYVVNRGTFYSVNNSGVKTALGTIGTTSGRVSMSDNGTQIVLVDGTAAYCYTTATASAAPQTVTVTTRSGTEATITTGAPHGLSSGCIVTMAGNTPAGYNGVYTVTVTGTSSFTYVMNADPGANSVLGSYTITPFVQITSGLPANPTTVAFLGGRFVFTHANMGRFYWSELYDGLIVNPLSYSNAETNPDPLQAVWASNGQLVLYGTKTTEYQGNSGALDSPFSSISGSSTEWGLAARWSVAKYDNSVAALYKNRMGQVMIARLSGYLPQKISTPDIDSIINSYSNVSDATAYSYMLGGHPMYVISFPSANATWLYDGSTSMWSPLKSLGLLRHRGEFGVSFNSKSMVADYSNGRIYIISAVNLTDNGDAIERSIVSENIQVGDMDRITVDLLRLDIQVGDGASNGQGSSPEIGLEVSRDNGNTWGAQMMRTMGALGNYATRVEWARLGEARSFVFRFTVTDPVQFTIISATVNPKD